MIILRSSEEISEIRKAGRIVASTLEKLKKCAKPGMATRELDDIARDEILRRNGLYSSELTDIRKKVEAGALQELGRKKYSKKPCSVSREEYDRLKTELAAKEKALAQMSEEYLILKKRTD